MEAINVTDDELIQIVRYVRERFTDRPQWENIEAIIMSLETH